MARETDKRWKGILIDWPTIEAMDAVDYELKALNQQQTAILLALLEYQKWPTRWVDLGLSKDELETYIADIEYRLMTSEGESMSIDYEAWGAAMKDALYEAANDIAKQIVSGGTTNFVVGDDGAVTVPSDAITPPVEDDPATPIDEGLSALNGAAIAVRLGLDAICTDMQTWYGVDAVADTPEATAQFRFKTKYDVDEAKASLFVTEWYTIRAASGTVITTFTSALDAKLFCKGVSKQTILTYIIASIAPAAQFLGTLLVDCLNQSQIDAWYASGSEVPSTTYEAYSCTKIDTETFQLNMALANTPQYTTSGVWKANHRYLIKISGTFVDADNPTIVGDGVYFHDTVSGVKTFIPPVFNFTGGVVVPTQAQLPYEPSGDYEFTVEKTNSNNAGIISRDNSTSMAIPNVVGILDFEIVDLGEFAI